jgi:cytochrome c1
MSHSTQEPLPRQRPGGKIMEFLILLAVLVAWVVLQAWVLPRFGVKT